MGTSQLMRQEINLYPNIALCQELGAELMDIIWIQVDLLPQLAFSLSGVNGNKTKPNELTKITWKEYWKDTYLAARRAFSQV